METVIFGKYLYTISPSDIVKFDSTNYIPVPSDWFTSRRMLQLETML